jgi:AraC-like DNA-binding protein
MDVLSDILRPLHLRGGVYFRCEFSAPWGMEMKPTARAEFHVVVRGNCWLRIAGHKDPIPLGSGDLVVLPKGNPHCLIDSPDSPARPAEEIAEGQNLDNYGPITYGGTGLPATVLCGYFEFDRSRPHPIVVALPELVHIRSTDSDDIAWLQAAVNFMIHETRAAKPGAELVVNRLVEVLFVQVIRAYLQQAHTPPKIWTAIADRQIGAALQAMHQTPQDAWTLETLARKVALSRSAFAARFSALVGETPLRYLTSLRMQKAQELLQGGRLSMAAIAGEAGYQSEPAFSKAFKKVVGKAPGSYRRSASQRS